MEYADYGYYSAMYDGRVIAETDFYRMSRQASIYLDSLTFEKITGAWELDERVRDACCAVAEQMYRQEQGGEISGESNHGISRTYVASGKTDKQKLYEIASMYLATTGLLYRGCD